MTAARAADLMADGAPVSAKQGTKMHTVIAKERKARIEPNQFRTVSNVRRASIWLDAEVKRARHKDPEFAKAHSERMRAMHQDPEFVRKSIKDADKVEIPKWVPANFIRTYIAHANMHGEEHAASVVRRLKSGSRV